MQDRDGRSAALVLKISLFLVFAAIAVFFVVQASLGARNAAGSPSPPEPINADRNFGETIYRSLDDLLGDLASTRVYVLIPSWELAVSGEVFIEEHGGFLYLTSNLGKVMAVDTATGNILWSLDLGVWVSAPPTAQDGVVYVGATNHVLYALDAGSGALLWYYTSQGEILAQPVVDNGMVFFTADNDSVYDLLHRLYALDARSGALLWIYDTESWTPSPPAVGDDAVYSGGYRREVYALDKHSGQELWSFEASNIVFSSPQVVEGKVLFTCIDGWVHALDAASGAPLWSRKLPGFVWLAPPDGSGNLYACSHRNTLTALALDTGEELWEFTDGVLLSCSTPADAEAVCAFNGEGKAYVLDETSGSILGLLLAPYDFISPPILVGNNIYASSSDGFVRAYAIAADRTP
jgi:outer membrane protein assembly factor BamB